LGFLQGLALGSMGDSFLRTLSRLCNGKDGRCSTTKNEDRLQKASKKRDAEEKEESDLVKISKIENSIEELAVEKRDIAENIFKKSGIVEEEKIAERLPPHVQERLS